MTDFVKKTLQVAYVKQVRFRSRNTTRIPTPDPALMNEVAVMLKNPKLSDLFVEAQFEAMPEPWCLQHFRRKWPPANVVFGSNSWNRYRDYVEKRNGFDR